VVGLRGLGVSDDPRLPGVEEIDIFNFLKGDNNEKP
jgi:hypothetical protein